MEKRSNKVAFFRKWGNTWQFRISYVVPITNISKEKSKGGFKTKKESQLAAHKREKELQNGFEQTGISLKTFLQEWLHEHKKDTIRRNTHDIHESNIRNHINPFFKNIALKDSTPLLYQRFLNSLHAAQYSKKTIEIVHGTMYNALNKAITLRKLKTNPC